MGEAGKQEPLTVVVPRESIESAWDAQSKHGVLFTPAGMFCWSANQELTLPITGDAENCGVEV